MRGTWVPKGARGSQMRLRRTTREEAVGVAGRRWGAARSAARAPCPAEGEAKARDSENGGQGAHRRLHTWCIEVRMA